MSISVASSAFQVGLADLPVPGFTRIGPDEVLHGYRPPQPRQ